MASLNLLAVGILSVHEMEVSDLDADLDAIRASARFDEGHSVVRRTVFYAFQ